MRAITDACSKSGVLCVIRLRKQKKEIAATVTRKNRQPNHRGVRSARDAAEEKGTRRESLLLGDQSKRLTIYGRGQQGDYGTKCLMHLYPCSMLGGIQMFCGWNIALICWHKQ